MFEAAIYGISNQAEASQGLIPTDEVVDVQKIELEEKYPTILPDSKDEARVYFYQECLERLGYPLGGFGADSDYSLQTVLDVARFQYSEGLDITGNLDPLTQKRLEEAVVDMHHFNPDKKPGLKELSLDESIAIASKLTGADPVYLAATAFLESTSGKNIKSKTTTALGSFQFTEDGMIKAIFHHGAKYGLERVVSKIEFKENGRAEIEDSSVKKYMMSLREKPLFSAIMAGEIAQSAKIYLEKKVGYEMNRTEMYMSHFLGPNGAKYFLTKMKKDPNIIGAQLFKAAAKNNKGAFYEDDKPLTLGEIYKKYDEKVKIQAELISVRFEQQDNLAATEMASMARSKKKPNIN